MPLDDPELERIRRRKIEELLARRGSGVEAMKAADERNFPGLISGSKPVLVDFWADWCGPCHMMAPVVEALATKYSEQMDFAKLNVDENPRIAERYMVHSIPTFIIFKDGKEAERIVGAAGREPMESFVRKHLQAT